MTSALESFASSSLFLRTMSYHQPPQTEFYGTHADPPPYQQDTQYRGAGEYDDGHEMAIGYGHPSHLIDRPLPNYKPASLRWSYLLFIVTIIGGYIAMTEYAIQRLPQETGKDLISDYEELERHQGAHFETVAVEERGETVRSFFLFPFKGGVAACSDGSNWYVHSLLSTAHSQQQHRISRLESPRRQRARPLPSFIL